MDELTIGEKTYVSSKRAAKITGYAKDYVGQLCREGRVEAKLVGRNWYVLEASIMEHRFGVAPSEEVSAAKEVLSPKVAISEAVWEAPKYQAEVPVMMPSLSSRPVEEPRRVVADMQSAWQEWFTTQSTAPKSLEAADADFDGHLLPVVEQAMPAEEEATIHEESVIIQHMDASAAHVPTTYEAPEEQVVLHRSYEELPVTSQVVQSDAYEDLRQVSRETERTELSQGGSSLVIKSLLIGIAFVAVCVALVGTGIVGDFVASTSLGGGAQSGLTELLRGSSEYKSIK